jgi:hypothetical protein
MTAKKPITATFYAQVTKKERWVGGNYVSGQVSKITQEKPSVTPKDTVTVKLTVELPAEAFEAFAPAAVIQIPAGLSSSTPIHVIVEDPA